MKIKTVNPATEEILAEYDALTEDQVNHEVNDSRKVYNSIWKKFDISERAKLIRNFGHNTHIPSYTFQVLQLTQKWVFPFHL